MNKLDQYVSRQFLNTLFFAIIAFCLIFVIIDLVENLDRFIDREVPQTVILQYYIYFIPYIIVLIIPIAMLLASLFSVGQLARYNEMGAMQTSGINLYRIASPLLVLGFVVSVLMIFFTEYVMPPASGKKFNIKRKYLDKISEKIFSQQSNINILQSEFERTYISHFEASTNTAHNVSIQKYHPGALESRLDARRMRWQGEYWLMEEGISRSFNGENEDVETFDERRIEDLPFRPNELSKVQKKPDEMNYFELKKFIRQIERNGANARKWLVDLHLKIAFPFSSFVIVLFGFPLAAMQKKSGKALGFGISLGICFVFFGLVKTLQTLGHNGVLAPWLAAWGSIFIVSGLGILLMIRSKK